MVKSASGICQHLHNHLIVHLLRIRINTFHTIVVPLNAFSFCVNAYFCSCSTYTIGYVRIPPPPNEKEKGQYMDCRAIWHSFFMVIMRGSGSATQVVLDLRKPIDKWHPDVATQLLVALDEDDSPTLRLWDMRNIMSPVKEFVGHTKGVIAMAWSSSDSSYLLTCAKDNRTICWDMVTGEDRETWGFLNVMFEDDGTARTKLLIHLGFSQTTEEKDTVQDDLSQSVNDITLEEKVGHQKEANLFAADNGEDFLNNLSSPKADTPVATSENKFHVESTVSSTDLTPQESYGLEESSDSSFDDAVQRALVVGDCKGAVAQCIAANKMADSLVIAHVGGTSLWESTLDQFLKMSHSPHLKVNFAPSPGTTQPAVRPFVPANHPGLRNADKYQQLTTLGSHLHPGAANPTYPIRQGTGSPSSVPPQMGSVSAPNMPPFVAPTPTSRGFMPVTVFQRPGMTPMQSGTPTQLAPIQPAAAPAAPHQLCRLPTLQICLPHAIWPPNFLGLLQNEGLLTEILSYVYLYTITLLHIPHKRARLKPVITTLTRLYNETSQAQGGSRANPAKKREIEDNSKKMGALFAKLNSGDVSKNASDKLIQLCQALDNNDFGTALQILVLLTTNEWDECNFWLATLKRMIKTRQNVRQTAVCGNAR
ncbi:protein transport protein SEC31 isoform 2 [Hibiscus syriacus]|uniref:Protein transport protein SEC31 isoform 2 n=1 Tax=Hibiscus syriacus TaxID=106335 RepID=A0A6A2WY57_HIBSY|nr:protein transport protein SEC31 isoform 2 [Hibiscus syriacus]